MPDALLDRSITIIRRTRDDSADDFASPAPTSSSEVVTVGALQQRQRTEVSGQGELSRTEWLLILGPDEEIDTTDAVRDNDDGREFEVVGDPWPVDDHSAGTVDHIEVTLERTGEPGEVGS